jgi:S-adenosylmethionine:diacylglycerol 3-amino-3-carboxypropyl transferase
MKPAELARSAGLGSVGRLRLRDLRKAMGDQAEADRFERYSASQGVMVTARGDGAWWRMDTRWYSALLDESRYASVDSGETWSQIDPQYCMTDETLPVANDTVYMKHADLR